LTGCRQYGKLPQLRLRKPGRASGTYSHCRRELRKVLGRSGTGLCGVQIRKRWTRRPSSLEAAPELRGSKARGEDWRGSLKDLGQGISTKIKTEMKINTSKRVSLSSNPSTPKKKVK
jgi:hypothetical protein